MSSSITQAQLIIPEVITKNNVNRVKGFNNESRSTCAVLNVKSGDILRTAKRGIKAKRTDINIPVRIPMNIEVQETNKLFYECKW